MLPELVRLSSCMLEAALPVLSSPALPVLSSPALPVLSSPALPVLSSPALAVSLPLDGTSVFSKGTSQKRFTLTGFRTAAFYSMRMRL